MVSKNKDYYEILGVERKATEAEIKKAFNKMAIKHHPDKGGSPEDFRKIKEAYDILSDKEKRKQYDQYGTTSDDAQNGAAGFDFNNFGFGGFDFGGFGFENIFEFAESFMGSNGQSRGGRSGAYPRSGEDIEQFMTISLEEAFSGIQKNISYTKNFSCDGCNGSGVKNTGSTQCSTCHGMGRTRTVKGFAVIERPCYVCKGTGISTDSLCEKCKGETCIRKQVKQVVNIPAGISTGQKMRMKGDGHTGILGGNAGDLIIHITVQNHPVFIVDGKNLIAHIIIPVDKVILGGEMEFKAIDGKKINVPIPKCIQANSKIKITGEGMTILNEKNKRGDLILTWDIKIPDKINSKQEELLKEAFSIENKGWIFNKIF